MNTATQFDTMGKNELRAACKEFGVKNYGKMNNDGMREALKAASDVPTCKETQAPTTNYAQLLGHAPAPEQPANTNGRKFVDGKEVGNKTKPAPAKRTDAPAVPRVSRKGYKIQKEREERNGVKRPSEGTVCGAVWAAFDDIMAKNGEVKAAELPALADENNWNRTNVSCEFYVWRKFMGIHGRSK